MIELLVVSVIWAFSFGIIKNSLVGVNPILISLVRLGIALMVFLPFLRLRGLPGKLVLRLSLIGAVQYGFMYLTYTSAFAYLKSYEVALFTIFTPLYVTLLHNAFQKKFNARFLAAALLSILGTAVVQGLGLLSSTSLTGFLLVQASNLCFAFGQVYYRKTMLANPKIADRRVFAILYLGGALVACSPAS